ncbi:acyl-CoA Delta12-desaturase-like isoform X2 [Panonychus citri]|uniref:acyl-CoA Delta12-desaturase-like isoform X2 n=1 Tax=Panonychus citri TaxID=50023 RepID=UPI002307FE4F|nr:acyl-CoA Delta12-desaturase-like isoform X2 [Panonychus citri]
MPPSQLDIPTTTDNRNEVVNNNLNIKQSTNDNLNDESIATTKSTSASLPTGVLIINGSTDINGDQLPMESKDDNINSSGLRGLIKFIVYEIKWIHLIFETSLALGFFYVAPISIYQFFAEFWTHSWLIMVLTWTWSFALITCGGIGVSVGAHRLWSHHAFKAKWPLKLLLVVMQTMGAENSIYHYVEHHRAHHKYLDTNGDPQNINRGFWFAQVGYRLLKDHPEYREKVKNISYDDILKDPFVMFQHNFSSSFTLERKFIKLISYCWLFQIIRGNTYARNCGQHLSHRRETAL